MGRLTEHYLKTSISKVSFLKINQVQSLNVVNEVLETFFKKGTETNNFMLAAEYEEHIENNRLFFGLSQNNAYFFVKRDGFFRCYYLVNDCDSIPVFESQDTFVIEILYRSHQPPPESILIFWEKTGFVKYLTRDHYILTLVPPIELIKDQDVSVRLADNLDEIQFTKHLIDSYIDQLTGDHLSFEELTEFATKKLIYIAYSGTSPCGIIQADFKNGIFWLGHLVVSQEFQGKGISKELLRFFFAQGKEQGCRQFQLWVRKDNLAAVQLYNKIGFKYSNKSTLSMIKN